MSLRTWKKLSRRNWTELSVTDDIIRKVEERGIKEFEELKSRKRGNNNEDRIIMQGEKIVFRNRTEKVIGIDPVTPPEPVVDAGESDDESLIETNLGEAALESVTEFTNRDSGCDEESTANSFTITDERSGKDNTVEGDSDKSIAEEENKNEECPSEDELETNTKRDDCQEITEEEITEECLSVNELEENTETSSRKEGLRPKRLVIFDHRYDHTRTVILAQMSVSKGLKVFGDRAADAVTKEFAQLDKLGVLTPKSFNDLSNDERKEALPAMVLIKEKRDGRINGRACTDGRR